MVIPYTEYLQLLSFLVRLFAKQGLIQVPWHSEVFFSDSEMAQLTMMIGK